MLSIDKKHDILISSIHLATCGYPVRETISFCWRREVKLCVTVVHSYRVIVDRQLSHGFTEATVRSTVQTVVYQTHAISASRLLMISAPPSSSFPGVPSHFPDVEALTVATPGVCASEYWLLHTHSRELSVSIFK